MSRCSEALAVPVQRRVPPVRMLLVGATKTPERWVEERDGGVIWLSGVMIAVEQEDLDLSLRKPSHLPDEEQTGLVIAPVAVIRDRRQRS